MTTATQPLRARWRVLLLAALAAVLALVLPAGAASASGLPAAETRVGVISPTVSTVVGVAEHIAAGQRRSRAPSQLRLVSGHCVAAEAGGAGERAIVVGEDMEGRVIPKAREMGADVYDPPTAPESEWMENNRKWINDRMDEGCTIYDCGAAPGRANYPNPTSPYYQMELDEIAKRGYTTTWVGGPR